MSSQGRGLKTRGKCQSLLIYEHMNMLLPKQGAQLFQKMVMKEEGRGIKVVDHLVKASHLSNCFMRELSINYNDDMRAKHSGFSINQRYHRKKASVQTNLNDASRKTHQLREKNNKMVMVTIWLESN